jgi:hypothetical protein
MRTRGGDATSRFHRWDSGDGHWRGTRIPLIPRGCPASYLGARTASYEKQVDEEHTDILEKWAYR